MATITTTVSDRIATLAAGRLHRDVVVSFGEIAETINRDDLTLEQGLTPTQREDAERRLAVALYELISANLARLASIALTEAREGA